MNLRSRSWPSRALPVLAGVVLSASLSVPAGAVAQVVTGVVVDAVTGGPVAGVSVRAVAADDREAAVATDSAGRFALPLSAGSYGFRIEHIAYEPLETERLAVARGEQVDVEIRLGPRPFDVEPLVVQARQRTPRSQFQRRMALQQATGQGRFITREEIEGTTVIGINELLAREMGLEVTTVGGARVVVIRARGRTCLPVLYVDGVQVRHDRQFPLDLAHLFRPDMVEGIEIYRSPMSAPADLRTNGCGAIAVWSRSDVEGGRPFTLRRLAFAAGWLTFFVLLRAL